MRTVEFKQTCTIIIQKNCFEIKKKNGLVMEYNLFVCLIDHSWAFISHALLF